jgi:hypothetical protein
MIEAKPFASLSSGLLARKGTAKPAMRPQGMGQFGSSIEDLGWNDMGSPAPARPVVAPAPPVCEEPVEEHLPSPVAALAPMGEQPEAFEPAPPIVEQQRAAIAASFAEPVEEEERSVLWAKAKKQIDDAEPEIEAVPEDEAEPVAEMPKAQAGTRAKAAFTLRLEAERHLKLRLACAVTGRSAQQLVTEALDQLLQSRPEIGALAEQVPGNARKP